MSKNTIIFNKEQLGNKLAQIIIDNFNNDYTNIGGFCFVLNHETGEVQILKTWFEASYYSIYNSGYLVNKTYLYHSNYNFGDMDYSDEDMKYINEVDAEWWLERVEEILIEQGYISE